MYTFVLERSVPIEQPVDQNSGKKRKPFISEPFPSHPKLPSLFWIISSTQNIPLLFRAPFVLGEGVFYLGEISHLKPALCLDADLH